MGFNLDPMLGGHCGHAIFVQAEIGSNETPGQTGKFRDAANQSDDAHSKTRTISQNLWL